MKNTVSCIILFVFTFAAGQVMADNSDKILDSSGVKGGLIVVVGCGDPELVTGLCDKGYVVHALDVDVKKVAAMREHIKAKGLYGKASAVEWTGKALPYVDNLVNLLIDVGGKATSREVLRVLAPGGASLIKGKKSTKPVPPGIDEWRHYLHDADNNAVARDTVVGAPRHMQWRAGPDWLRHHGKLASISAAVTAKGRIFTVVDSATTGPAKIAARWRLVARDAFNGLKLWEKDISSWTSVNRGFRSGPVQVTRLLVTDGDRVFAPLANDKPITALDAATGEVINSFEGTENAEEILMVDSKLIVYRSSGSPAQASSSTKKPKKKRGQKAKPTPKPTAKPEKGKSIDVVDAKSGKTIWSHEAVGEKAPTPQTIASDGKRIYYQSAAGVTALDIAGGKELWSTPAGTVKSSDRSGMGSVLVVSDGVVLAHAGGLQAISAINGKLLWKIPSKSGFRSPPDILVVNGQVWYGSGFAAAYDLKTGKVVRNSDLYGQVTTVGHHHRCYRSKASVNFLMGGYRGIEMFDLHGDDHSRNNWVRGLCQYGIMPANGLIYAPGHSCSCYMESLLFGFYALAPKRVSPVSARVSGQERLVRGPAYKAIKAATSSEGWPTFRGDAMRRGISASKVTAKMAPAWSVRVGVRITGPVVADGTVIVSDIDAHTIHALGEKDGKELWTFTAGGRVDTPPTIAGNAVVFGSMGGNVYCVSLKDGELAWKFRAAPSMLNAMALEQLESVWPVHGSVLVKDKIAYFTAGRNTFIDGGLHMYAVDVATGRLIASNNLATGHGTAHPEGGKKVGGHTQNSWDIKTAEHPDKSDAFSMGGCKNDIMSTDGTSVFLHHLRFNAKLENQARKTRHLFSTSNFADGNENHRSHWFLGYGDFTQLGVAYEWMTASSSRWGAMRAIKGVMISYDDSAAYVVDRGYELRRHKNTPFDPEEKSQRDFGRSGQGVKTVEWKASVSIRPRTIVKAGDTLVVGGMPDETDTAFPYELVEGKRAGLIRMFSPVDGKPADEIKLPAAVVWDGIAPANNKLFVSTVDGKLTCLK